MGKTGTKAATSSARRGTADENDVGLQLKLNGKPYKELVKIAHPRSFAIRKPLLSRFKVIAITGFALAVAPSAEAVSPASRFISRTA